ncbi:MAG: flavodoxin-dependent (E)-4-hydroxy-3-methylbut-2-enyl-diphosphate synthase [Thermotogota bacterium]
MFSEKFVNVSNIKIGGDYPVVIQTMTNTDSSDFDSTINQIKQLNAAGAELIRLSIRNLEDIITLKKLVKKSPVPLIADIHFDYKIAIDAIKAGIAKIRLNPGNIGSDWKVKEVVKVAKEYKTPIRVGANSGSLDKRFEDDTIEMAMVNSALYQVRLLEQNGFNDIVISMKSSDVRQTYLSNKIISEKIEYPLHLGVTEAGVYEDSIISSSAGIGALLLNNIGDTIRISISGNPVNEVLAAKKLLTTLGLRKGIKVISCPTCARTEINIEDLTNKVKLITKKFENLEKNITIAVMGCVVNGPGEAKHADIAIAGSRQSAAIFKKGKLIENVKKEDIEKKLTEIIENYIEVV